MDRAKLARNIERNFINRLLDTLNTDLAKTPLPEEEVITSLQMLESRMATLTELDETVKGLLLDLPDTVETTMEVEYGECDVYIRKVTHMKVRVERIFNPKTTVQSTHSSHHSVSSGNFNRRVKLPKIELKKFGGELLDWLGWWAQFAKIDEDEELHDSDKFSYLLQSMIPGSKAEEIVKRYPQSTENYPKAIIALKERFGQPRLLEDVYMRELAKLLYMSKEKFPLSKFYDKLQASLHSLESLGVSTEEMRRFLFPMIESSLQEETLIAWQRSSNFRKDGSKEVPPCSELDYLMSFLKSEIDNEEQRKMARSGFGQSTEKKKGHGRQVVIEDDVPTAAGLFSGSNSSRDKPMCIFCEKGHSSADCGKAQDMTLEEKNNLIMKKGVCYKCLKKGHMAGKCKKFVKCIICGKKHLTLLCPQLGQKKTTEEKTVLSSLNCTSEVLLQTLMVKLVNPVSNRSKKVRVLIDCGSQRSYVLEKTAKELKLKTKETVTMNHSLFGGTRVMGHVHSVYQVLIGSVFDSFSVPMTLIDQPRICGSIPRISQGEWIEDLKLKGICISDLDPMNSGEIEILLGADVLGRILTDKIHQLDNGLTATETRLGWTVMGMVNGERGSEALTLSVISMTISSSTVSQLWDLETIGIRDPVERKSEEEREKEALEYFKDTVTREPNGSYTVCLPWVKGAQLPPSNFEVARKRLDTTTRKLKALGQFSVYDKVFKDWESEGIISEISECESDSCHYLPHRAVFKTSQSTPVRPVFDASCKLGRNPSLNICLEKGPNLLDVIPSILLRFRTRKIGVTADIRKAFLMINVNERDRDFLRFLWWEDAEQQKLKVYRHNRVVFGMNCSPFLLGAVIFYHLDKHRSQNPSVVSLIERSLYVDNLVLAVDSVSELETVRKVSTELLSSAGMELRQWEWSGDSSVTAVANVLGLKWDKVEDSLFCETIQTEIPLKITKRVILSHIQRAFDPLGFLCPVLIVPKTLLQQAWNQNKNWDEDVSEDTKLEFMLWSKEFSEVMDKVKIPRNCNIGDGKDGDKFQLHVFGDASKKAYAAVAFLRVEINSVVKVYFLQAKSRVAPLKPATIPRLELLSCTIATRLSSSVKCALNLKCDTYFWSDSSTALAWIRGRDDWGTFVGNRVREICSLSQVSDWNHVPGIHNPADLPSRGISPLKYVESKWWEGPQWLSRPKSEWPKSEVEVDQEEVNQERKKTISTLNVTSSSCDWLIRKNKHHDNMCVWAFVFRFLDLTRKKTIEKSGRPTTDELITTELRLVKLLQSKSFPAEKSVINGLKVEVDGEGLIRVKTKVTNRVDTDTFRKPILLPHAHPFVDSIISEVHWQNSHGGAQLVMAKLRERFWIIQNRRAIRKVLKRCVLCRRFDGKKGKVETCPLPEARVKNSSAFEVTGVDLAGPLTLKNKSKVYIVLFTCAVYRCVHLELTESLTTEDFVMSFVRFSKRKQRPSIVYSDNGKNFVGAVNLFKTIDWDAVARRTEQYRVKWIFNPPSAPWWGGFWERLVRSVKDLLRRMLGFAKLSYVQLETALCEVEAAVNHRPLTYVTEDQEDFVPITPAMFIHQLPHSEVPEVEVLTGSDLDKKRRSLDQLMKEIQARFRSEYLGHLVQRGKEHAGDRKFVVGEVVLVEVDGQKRIMWPMARIQELIVGKDGETRVARLKTKTGSLLRPIQRLVPLEVFGDSVPVISVPKITKKTVQKKERPETLEVIPSDGQVTKSGRVVKKPDRYGEVSK